MQLSSVHKTLYLPSASMYKTVIFSNIEHVSNKRLVIICKKNFFFSFKCEHTNAELMALNHKITGVKERSGFLNSSSTKTQINTGGIY